jgi:hypothetical protein
VYSELCDKFILLVPLNVKVTNENDVVNVETSIASDVANSVPVGRPLVPGVPVRA